MPEIEHVLVIPTRLFHDLGHFQGFHEDVERYLSRLLQPENVSYRPRDAMEQDPSFKQLIPYVVFTHRGPDGLEVLQYQRGGGQGESRLHAKRSIGVGGHVSSVDARVGDDPYQEGLRRELDEEVLVRTATRETKVGLINDDETEVGRVHLGVVHVYETETRDISPREDEMHDCRFMLLEQLRQDREQFETWSQICMDHLFD